MNDIQQYLTDPVYNDIIVLILGYLTINELKSIKTICKNISNIYHSKELWLGKIHTLLLNTSKEVSVDCAVSNVQFNTNDAYALHKMYCYMKTFDIISVLLLFDEHEVLRQAHFSGLEEAQLLVKFTRKFNVDPKSYKCRPWSSFSGRGDMSFNPSYQNEKWLRGVIARKSSFGFGSNDDLRFMTYNRKKSKLSKAQEVDDA